MTAFPFMGNSPAVYLFRRSSSTRDEPDQVSSKLAGSIGNSHQLFRPCENITSPYGTAAIPSSDSRRAQRDPVLLRATTSCIPVTKSRNVLMLSNIISITRALTCKPFQARNLSCKLTRTHPSRSIASCRCLHLLKCLAARVKRPSAAVGRTRQSLPELVLVALIRTASSNQWPARLFKEVSSRACQRTCAPAQSNFTPSLAAAIMVLVGLVESS